MSDPDRKARRIRIIIVVSSTPHPGDEHVLVGNLRSSLTDAGALIVGTPSIESSASTAKGIDDLSLTGPTTTFTGSNGRARPGRPEAE
jgi:hypothetical protein